MNLKGIELRIPIIQGGMGVGLPMKLPDLTKGTGCLAAPIVSAEH